MSSRRAFRSATVGRVAISIFWRVSFSICRSIRSSRGWARVIATPARPARPGAARAVDVHLRRRGHVVVHDVGQAGDVEAARGDVGGDEQVGGPFAEALHHPVALLLGEPAVDGVDAVAAGGQRFLQLVHLAPRAAEDEGGGRGFHVEHAAQGGRLLGAPDDVGDLPQLRARRCAAAPR